MVGAELQKPSHCVPIARRGGFCIEGEVRRGASHLSERYLPPIRKGAALTGNQPAAQSFAGSFRSCNTCRLAVLGVYCDPYHHERGGHLR
jgi:hypothetical protein